MNESVRNIIETGFVMLTEPIICPKCGSVVRLVGERRPNGNWYCPADICDYWLPLRSEATFSATDLAVKVKDESQVVLPEDYFAAVARAEGLLAADEFVPRGLAAFPLDPSWKKRRKITKKQLLAEAEDFTRTGRVKSGIRYEWNLAFDGFQVDEYESLVSFWDAHPYSVPFSFTDNVLETTHTCYFNSEIDSEDVDFDTVDFSVIIVGS